MLAFMLRRWCNALLTTAAICSATFASAQGVCDSGPGRSLPGMTTLIGSDPNDRKIAEKFDELCHTLMWETGISFKQTPRYAANRTYYCQYVIRRTLTDAHQWRDKVRERIGIADWGETFMEWLPGTMPQNESFGAVRSALRKFKMGSGAAPRNMPLQYREGLGLNAGALLIGLDGRSGEIVAVVSDVDSLYDATPLIRTAAGAADLITLQNLTASENHRSFVPGICSAKVSSDNEAGWLLKDVAAVIYDNQVPYFVQRDYRVSREGRIDVLDERRIKALPLPPVE
jgi:hypothetical protein